MLELDECIVICANCHKTIHFDDEKYKNFENKITDKVSNIKEPQPKIDRQLVSDLLDEGYIQRDIAIKLNTSKSTISGIVKEIGR